MSPIQLRIEALRLSVQKGGPNTVKVAEEFLAFLSVEERNESAAAGRPQQTPAPKRQAAGGTGQPKAASN